MEVIVDIMLESDAVPSLCCFEEAAGIVEVTKMTNPTYLGVVCRIDMTPGGEAERPALPGGDCFQVVSETLHTAFQSLSDYLFCPFSFGLHLVPVI